MEQNEVTHHVFANDNDSSPRFRRVKTQVAGLLPVSTLQVMSDGSVVVTTDREEAVVGGCSWRLTF